MLNGHHTTHTDTASNPHTGEVLLVNSLPPRNPDPGPAYIIRAGKIVLSQFNTRASTKERRRSSCLVRAMATANQPEPVPPHGGLDDRVLSRREGGRRRNLHRLFVQNPAVHADEWRGRGIGQDFVASWNQLDGKTGATKSQTTTNLVELFKCRCVNAHHMYDMSTTTDHSMVG